MEEYKAFRPPFHFARAGKCVTVRAGERCVASSFYPRIPMRGELLGGGTDRRPHATEELRT